MFAWVVLPLAFWNIASLALMVVGGNPEVENGPLEDLQVLFLLLGGVIFLREMFGANAAGRVIFGGVALLHFTILLLELELREFNLPVVNFFINGRFRDIWVGALWLLALVFFLKRRGEVWAAFLRWLRSPGARLLVAAGFLWLVSGVVDKADLFEPHLVNEFVEEVVEINATWLMFVAAMWNRRQRLLAGSGT